jgi:hypothetical protein
MRLVYGPKWPSAELPSTQTLYGLMEHPAGWPRLFQNGSKVVQRKNRQPLPKQQETSMPQHERFPYSGAIDADGDHDGLLTTRS